METCPSFRLYGKGRPRLVNARRPQRVLYFYFLDPALSLIYIRLTTWFPFTVQIYANGHSWLEKQMLKRRMGFTLRDNAFTALDDPQAAQKLADSFAHLNWRKILNRLVRQVNPLMRERWFRGYSYYWVVDQAEYAIGTLIKFQLHDHIAREILKRDPRDCNYYGDKQVGDFLWGILALGVTRDWNIVLREANGEGLSARALVDYFAPLSAWLARENQGHQVGWS
jgi:hypothetical protein